MRSYVARLLNMSGRISFWDSKQTRNEGQNTDAYSTGSYESLVNDLMSYGYPMGRSGTYTVNQSECCKKTPVIREEDESYSNKGSREIYRNYADVLGNYDCCSDHMPTVNSSESAIRKHSAERKVQKKSPGSSRQVSKVSSCASKRSKLSEYGREYADEPCNVALCDCPICEKKTKTNLTSTISSSSCLCETCACTQCVSSLNKKSNQSLAKDICDCCSCKGCEQIKKLRAQLTKEVEIKAPIKRAIKIDQKAPQRRTEPPPRIVSKVLPKQGPCSCEICECLRCHDESARYRRPTSGRYDTNAGCPVPCSRDSCVCILCEAKKLGQTVINYDTREPIKCGHDPCDCKECVCPPTDKPSKEQTAPISCGHDPCDCKECVCPQTDKSSKVQTAPISCGHDPCDCKECVCPPTDKSSKVQTAPISCGHDPCDCKECVCPSVDKSSKVQTAPISCGHDPCGCGECLCPSTDKSSKVQTASPPKPVAKKESCCKPPLLKVSLRTIAEKESCCKPPSLKDPCGESGMSPRPSVRMQLDDNRSCTNASVRSQPSNNVCANSSAMDCTCRVCNCRECRAKKPTSLPVQQDRCTCRQCPHVMCGFHVKPKLRHKEERSAYASAQMGKSCEPYIHGVTVNDSKTGRATEIALDKGGKVNHKSLTLDIEIVKQKKGNYMISIKNTKAPPLIARPNQKCHDPRAPDECGCDLCVTKTCSRIKLQNPEVNRAIYDNTTPTEDQTPKCLSRANNDNAPKKYCSAQSKPSNTRNNVPTCVCQPCSCCVTCRQKQSNNRSGRDKRMLDVSTSMSAHTSRCHLNADPYAGNRGRNDNSPKPNSCYTATDFKGKCATFMKTDMENNIVIRKLKNLGNNIIREQYLFWLSNQPQSVQSLLSANENDKPKCNRRNYKLNKEHNQVMAILVNEDLHMNLIDGESSVDATYGSDENDLRMSNISSSIKLWNTIPNDRCLLRKNEREIKSRSMVCNNISSSQSYHERGCNKDVVQSLKDCILEQTKCCVGAEIENGSGEFRPSSTCTSINKYCLIQRNRYKEWNERV